MLKARSSLEEKEHISDFDVQEALNNAYQASVHIQSNGMSAETTR